MSPSKAAPRIAGMRRRSGAKESETGETGSSEALDRRTQEDTPTRWSVLLRPPIIIGTAMLVAIGGLLVNQYVPPLLEQTQDQDPLRIIAGYDADRYADGWWMATPTALDPSSAPTPGSADEDVRAWVTEQEDGVHINESWLQMLVEGRRTGGVVIDSMEARVLEREEPLSGSLVYSESAGSEESIAVGFDLDSPNPIARFVNDDGTLGDPYFGVNIVTIAKEETVPFSVVGRTDTSYVKWVIDLHIVVDGEEKVMTVGGDGYGTTAEADKYESVWSWEWADPPAHFEEVSTPSR